MKYDDIINVIWGATLMGGGGGGSMKNGLDMLHKYMADRHLTPENIFIVLLDPDDLDPDAYAAVTAGMGAPTAIKDVDFSVYATNAFNLLTEMAAQTGRKITYSMAVELGGFNTFVPMLISLVQQIPFVDTDGAARAVPALNTLLLHVNGNDTSPLAMADGYDGTTECDKVTISLKDPKDAQMAELLGRDILHDFGKNMSGLSGWMLKQDAIKKTLPANTVTLCQKIGTILQDTVSEKFLRLRQLGIVECHEIARGQVTAGETKQGAGFDYGYVEVTDQASGKIFRVDFQNENLVLSAGGGKIGQVVMTAPDVIACYDFDTNEPLTNADFFDEHGKLIPRRAVMGVIRVSDRWWDTGYAHVNSIWKEYFKNVGYAGDVIPYRKTAEEEAAAVKEGTAAVAAAE
jgi:hypothetical protein